MSFELSIVLKLRLTIYARKLITSTRKILANVNYKDLAKKWLHIDRREHVLFPLSQQNTDFGVVWQLPPLAFLSAINAVILFELAFFKIRRPCTCDGIRKTSRNSFVAAIFQICAVWSVFWIETYNWGVWDDVSPAASSNMVWRWLSSGFFNRWLPRLFSLSTQKAASENRTHPHTARNDVGRHRLNKVNITILEWPEKRTKYFFRFSRIRQHVRPIWWYVETGIMNEHYHIWSVVDAKSRLSAFSRRMTESDLGHVGKKFIGRSQKQWTKHSPKRKPATHFPTINSFLRRHFFAGIVSGHVLKWILTLILNLIILTLDLGSWVFWKFVHFSFQFMSTHRPMDPRMRQQFLENQFRQQQMLRGSQFSIFVSPSTPLCEP